MTRTRRSLLAVCAGALAGAAGCIGTTTTGDGSTTTGDVDRSPPGTTSVDTSTEPTLYEFGTEGSVGDVTATPTGAHVQCSTHYLSTPDQMGVIDPDGKRLLFVDVTVSGDGPEPSGWLLEAGGERYRGWTRYDGVGGHSLAPDGRRGEAYRPDEPTGWIGFELPVPVDADELRLRLDRDGSPVWVLPEAPLSTLRAGDPAFEVRSVDVPDTVADLGAIPFEITVGNAGEGAGTFRYSVNYRGPLYAADPWRIDLAAGETRTVETTLEPYGSGHGDEMTFAVTTAADSREFTVRADSSDDG